MWNLILKYGDLKAQGDEEEPSESQMEGSYVAPKKGRIASNWKLYSYFGKRNRNYEYSYAFNNSNSYTNYIYL